jgi:hypothetical protein
MVDVQQTVYRSIQDLPRFANDVSSASAWNSGSWIESVDNRQLVQIEYLKWALKPSGYFSIGSLDDRSQLVVFQMVPSTS